MLDYVEGLDFTDPDNIFVVGKSMGAVDAVLASQGRGDEIRAMCLWYPGFGVTDAVRHGFLLGSFFNPIDLPDTRRPPAIPTARVSSRRHGRWIIRAPARAIPARC